VEEWLAAHGTALSARAELHGETAFCYLEDPAPVVRSLRDFPRLRFVHRPANLEDLFLKLTGRELRE
jgi:lipooligosaccharide transport system ATP-binding protein